MSLFRGVSRLSGGLFRTPVPPPPPKSSFGFYSKAGLATAILLAGTEAAGRSGWLGRELEEGLSGHVASWFKASPGKLSKKLKDDISQESSELAQIVDEKVDQLVRGGVSPVRHPDFRNDVKELRAMKSTHPEKYKEIKTLKLGQLKEFETKHGEFANKQAVNKHFQNGLQTLQQFAHELESFTTPMHGNFVKLKFQDEETIKLYYPQDMSKDKAVQVIRDNISNAFVGQAKYKPEIKDWNLAEFKAAEERLKKEENELKTADQALKTAKENAANNKDKAQNASLDEAVKQAEKAQKEKEIRHTKTKMFIADQKNIEAMKAQLAIENAKNILAKVDEQPDVKKALEELETAQQNYQDALRKEAEHSGTLDKIKTAVNPANSSQNLEKLVAAKQEAVKKARKDETDAAEKVIVEQEKTLKDCDRTVYTLQNAPEKVKENGKIKYKKAGNALSANQKSNLKQQALTNTSQMDKNQDVALKASLEQLSKKAGYTKTFSGDKVYADKLNAHIKEWETILSNYSKYIKRAELDARANKKEVVQTDKNAAKIHVGFRTGTIEFLNGEKMEIAWKEEREFKKGHSEGRLHRKKEHHPLLRYLDANEFTAHTTGLKSEPTQKEPHRQVPTASSKRVYERKIEKPRPARPERTEYKAKHVRKNRLDSPQRTNARPGKSTVLPNDAFKNYAKLQYEASK